MVPSSIVESSNSTSLRLSALFSNRVGSHERLGPCGDRPTPCCSAHRALGALRLSNITLHSGNPVLQHNRELPTLSEAHRYVLVRPPAEDAPWSPSPPIGPLGPLPWLPLDPPQENILSRSRNLIPEAILSDVIHQQLTDVCFLDIGTREDQISQKPLFHHDKMENI